jgi:L-fuconolactonase
MFGSDWPVCLLAGSYRQVMELVCGYIGALPKEKQDRILGLNAVEFYGVKEGVGIP